MSRAALATVLFALCSACQVMQSMLSRRTLPHDPHSYAEPNRVRVRHVSLELALDFQRRCAEGSARLDLERTERSAPLKLDVRALDVLGVTGSAGGKRKFLVGREHPSLGSALTIELADGDESVTVHYKTAPSAQAMQWLEPAQTRGGNHPFLFTQGQAILTRTWIPLQDSPGVRVTYEARVRAPEDLTVVMSAEQLGRDAQGAWRFRMAEAIPPYLIALACGALEFRPISQRCGAWAEAGVVDAAASEFADVEAMLAAAERLFGPYRWGRYDLLILPPSFPYGGMENPRLTFLTPTILAGDRSLVALVAHELAHSWSGNLVTNATWRDFWLNEGFTVYIENRLMEEVFGTGRAAMEQVLARAELEEELAGMQPRDTVLHIDLAGRHPDDGFSGVPYEKGALFLRRLEQIVGRETFDAFLRGWFDAHAFRSVTTSTFLAWLDQRLLAPAPALAAQIDVDAWMNAPGLPADAPRANSDALARVEAAVTEWRAGRAAAQLDTTDWVTQQWQHFLAVLPADVDAEGLEQLDAAFELTASGNSEILCAWLELSIQKGYAPGEAALEPFLMRVGRRKFLTPLYKALLASPGGRERALELYGRARPRYHAVATKTLDGLLDWKG
jgi:aminopeptidase N